MHASVLTSDVKPESWDELARLYEEVVMPLIGGESGIKAAFLLKMPGDEEAMSVGIYETIDQAIASGETDGAFYQAEGKLAHTLTSMPVRSICEVLAHG